MRWEARLRSQVVLSIVGFLLALPLLASLLGVEVIRPLLAVVRELMENHWFREVSGYAALTVVLFQSLLSARKRTRVPLKGSYAAWRSAHMLVGVALLLLVLVHTGGRWGANLNGWLLTAFVLTTFAALAGKLFEARVLDRRVVRMASDPAGAAPPGRRAVTARLVLALTGSARLLAPVALVRFETSAVAARFAPSRPGGFSVARVRRFWVAAHVLGVVAMLVLLGFHIFSVYYF